MNVLSVSDTVFYIEEALQQIKQIIMIVESEENEIHNILQINH